MNEEIGLATSNRQDPCETARELFRRHGEHAQDYVRARIEACVTAGERTDAAAWRQVLTLLP
jgi:hypothetical protein